MANTTAEDVNMTKCAHCSKIAARACTGCKDSPNANNTYYCNGACQTAGWKVHRNDCKRLQTRKALYQGGSLLQEVFYIYREKVFDKLVVRVEEKNGEVYTHEGIYNRPVSFVDYFLPFPKDLVPKKEDRQGLLTYLACSDAVGWMHDMIKHVLADVVSVFEERRTIPKNFKREWVGVAANGEVDKNRFYHEVLMVKLKNGGEEYIIDLAGAQHGYYEPVVPLMDYERDRVEAWRHNPGFMYFGGMRDELIKMSETDSRTNLVIAYKNNMLCSDLLKRIMESWEMADKLSVQAMLKLPKAGFEEKLKALLGRYDFTLELLIRTVRNMSASGLAKRGNANAGAESSAV